jgi:GNAT superfamily N-acetyltransferase
MNIKYRPFQPNDLDEVKNMAKNFYLESPGGVKIHDKNIVRTFHEFTLHPEKGDLIVMESGKDVIGYALLFKGWSNEHGKDLIFIDELYVAKPFRNKGVGSGLIRYIIGKFKKKAAALMLAAEPGNEKVETFYRKMGFKLHENKTFSLKL